MNIIIKTNFKVGSNLINLVPTENGYQVTNRKGVSFGYLNKTFGWCFIAETISGYNFAQKVNEVYPFDNAYLAFLEDNV